MRATSTSGERLTGQVVVKVDSANGGALYDASGNPLNGAQQGSTVVYSIDPADLAGLQLGAGQHYSGDLSVTVEATTEDLNGDKRFSKPYARIIKSVLATTYIN